MNNLHTIYHTTTYDINDTLVSGSYSVNKNIRIPFNIGFDLDSAYVKSYLFSSNEARVNTLKSFGISKEDIGKNKLSDYDLVKSVCGNFSKTGKSKSDESNYYMYLHSDYNNKVFERSVYTNIDAEGNNIIQDSLIISISPNADLIVDTLSVSSDSVMVGNYFEFSWRVTNDGDTLAYGPWTDKIYLSTDSVWNVDSARLLYEFENKDSLEIGQSYNKSKLCQIPKDVYLENESSQFYVHVITDIVNNVYERYDEDNNISEPILLTIYKDLGPLVDLEAIEIIVPENALSGSKINISWSVENTGPEATGCFWTDGLILSEKPVGDSYVNLNLNQFEPYERTDQIEIPNDMVGDYSIKLIVDAGEKVNDTERSNNSITSSNIHITLRDPSDLIVDSLSLPDTLKAGQRFDIIYTVKNQGIGVTDYHKWSDGFYLSSDLNISSGDLLLGTNERLGSLQPGQVYTDTMTINLSTQVYGDFVLLAKADCMNDVYEHEKEDNNIKYEFANVNLTEIVDLAVSDVLISEPTITLGDSISVNYTLVNNSTENDAKGWIRDAVYVSLDSIWQPEDILIDFMDYEIDLPAGQSKVVKSFIDLTQSYPTDDKGLPLVEGKGDISSILPGVSPGNYYIIANTNIRQTIRESNVDNNSAYSENPFAVSVPEITLNSTSALQDSISNVGINYYQVEVDSLGDESLQIVLDGLILDKGTTTFNEMYVKYGEMPTLSNYEHSYDKPNSADQTIMIPNTQIGTYYIMVKNSYQDTEFQNISLHSRLVGFELLGIDQAVGGNSGEITIKLSGSAFSYGVKPVLEQSEVNFIYAKETYLTDNTELYATFDLKGANSGSWDVKLIKDMSRYDWIYKELYIDELDTTIMVPDSMYLVSDSLVAELSGAFYITTSDNKGYLENIDKPETARGGRGFSASVEIINLSNNDMVAPLYMLKSNSFMTKLPGEDEYTLGYKKFLMLSKDGPAGVLRPGERTTINILAEAPMITGNMVFRIVKIQESGFEFDFNRELFWTGANRENPNWTEAIYALEQEIGNSWEGYNRVLSNSMNKSGFNDLCIASKILNNLIGDTAHNLKFASGKNQIVDLSKYGYKESVNKFVANGTKDDPDPNIIEDLYDPKHRLTQEQIDYILRIRELIAKLKILKITNPEFYHELMNDYRDTVRGWMLFTYPHQGRFFDFLQNFLGDDYDDGICGIDDRFAQFAWFKNMYKKDLRGSSGAFFENMLWNSKSIIESHLKAGNTYPLTINLLLKYPTDAKTFMPDFHLQFQGADLSSISTPLGQMPHCFGAINGYNYAFFIIDNIKKEELTKKECQDNPDASHKITYDLYFLISMTDTFDFSEANTVSGAPDELTKSAWILQQLGEAKPFPTELIVHEVIPMTYIYCK